MFYDRHSADGLGRCGIHRTLGHESLPLACRQFPRVSLRDPRGVAVTLSHYCPTAAGLIESDLHQPFSIVSGAPSFPADGEYVGLDARQALPPLLRPGLLMDWESWWECERLAVDLLSGARDAEFALGKLRGVVRELTRWSPENGALIERVRFAFAAPREPSMPPDGNLLIAALLASIPGDLRPRHLTRDVVTSPRASLRFVAAHAFANWRVHSSDGLHGWLASLETAGALLKEGYGLRQADLLLRHLAD